MALIIVKTVECKQPEVKGCAPVISAATQRFNYFAPLNFSCNSALSKDHSWNCFMDVSWSGELLEGVEQTVYCCQWCRGC